jgi:hypothetical protein
VRRTPAPAVPPLAERQRPGLSVTLTGPVHPNVCQSCAGLGQVRGMRYWRECDEWDKPTPTVVALCPTCSDRLITPHARLYVAIDHNEPVPGVMALCSLCRHRAGTRCTLARVHGGPGVIVTAAKPTVMFICGRGIGGALRHYPRPASACSGREEIASE